MKSICYVSCELIAAELKYSIIEKEVLDFLWGIEKSHLCLYGKQFDVRVDNQPLNYIYPLVSKLNACISTWQMKLRF